MKQFAGDIIVLHMCSKNRNHMMYGYWDRTNFLTICHFLLFCYPQPPSLPLTIQKNESFEQKWNKFLEILSFDSYMYATN